jgi:hypothetical protein
MSGSVSTRQLTSLVVARAMTGRNSAARVEVFARERRDGWTCFQLRWWVYSTVTYGPYVTQHRKERPHMSTKSALRADLDAEGRICNTAPKVSPYAGRAIAG